MSQYMCFYIKNDNNSGYTYLSSFSSSHCIYEALEGYCSEYGKCSIITNEQLKYAIGDINEEISNLEKLIKRDEKMIEHLRLMTQDVNELIDSIYQYEASIEDSKESIERRKAALIILYYFQDLNEKDSFNKDHKRIYAGIEASMPETIDEKTKDISEKEENEEENE